MIVKTLTLTAPSGASVTLGSLTASAGDLYGFTLGDCAIDPAPVVLNQRNLPLVAGGVVSGGRYGVRTVTFSGFIVGRNANETNALRRTLVSVLKDHGETALITVRYTLEGADRELTGQLDGSVVFRPAGGHYVSFEAAIVCGDPVAKGTTSLSAMAGTYPGSPFVNAGDAQVFPTLTITALASTTVTSVRVGNSTTGQYLDVSGISLTSAGTLVVEMTPGREVVTLNGVSILDKVSVGSRFWYLAPGTNQLYVTDQSAVGADNARATIAWRSGWVS